MAWRLSHAAAKDVRNILLHSLRRYGVRQARRYRSGLERAFDSLARSPEMSRLRPELRQNPRIHPYGAHVIIYRIVNADIEIIRVRHGHEDWQADPADWRED